MKLTARVVTQDSQKFYETAIPAQELIDDSLFRPDRWNPVNNEGYQRELSQEHARRIQQFLKGDNGTNVLPTNVIVNSRKPFRVESLGDGFVEIEIKDFPLYIIDGQHRISAMRQAEESGTADLTHYEIGVTLTQFNLRDEMIHFRNINGRANRPPKALSDVLMGRLAEEYGLVPSSIEEQSIIRANRVVMRLATDLNSPWYGKIALGGTRRRAFHITVQSAMTSSMLAMFSNGRFSDPDEDVDHIYRIFADFWEAIADVWPETMENPYQYLLMRGGGFYAWHRVLARILTNLNFNPTKAQFVAALTELRETTGWDADFWQFSTLGNTAGARQLMLASGNGGSTQRGSMLADMVYRELDKDALRDDAHTLRPGVPQEVSRG